MKDYRTWWRKGQNACSEMDCHGKHLRALLELRQVGGFDADDNDCMKEQLWAQGEGLV